MWLAVCTVSFCFVLYSSPTANLFCEYVSSDKHSSWTIIIVDQACSKCRRILVLELEAGKPAHLAY